MVDIKAETWYKAEISVIRVHRNGYVNRKLLQLLCISDFAER